MQQKLRYKTQCNTFSNYHVILHQCNCCGNVVALFSALTKPSIEFGGNGSIPIRALCILWFNYCLHPRKLHYVLQHMYER